MSTKKINDVQYNYQAVVETPIFKVGEGFSLESGYYTNRAETIILRSTNATGKIIKKIKDVK